MSKEKTSLGFIWSAIERFSVQAVQFLFQIILARLLSPSDYGIIAMLAIFMAIAQSFIDSGFANALIKKTNRTAEDFTTVFYFNITIGIVLYAVLYFTAPYIARFYNTPELVDITRVYMVILPITALCAIQRTQYVINVNFRDQAVASIIGALAGGIVGVVLAANGAGVWALVYSAIVNNIITAVVFWLRSPWRPDAKFSIVSLKSMFSFGSKLLFSGLLDTTYKNLYQFVIGKKFSKQDLGYYSRADQFAQFPSSNITAIMQRVTYPVLCSLAGDEDELLQAYRRYIKLSTYIIFPLMIGLSAVAKPFIYLVLGQKWESVAIILQIICLSSMWYPVHAINLNVLMVKGRSDLFLRVEVIKKVLGISILLVVMNFNVQVMALGGLVASIVALFINTHYTKRLMGYGIAKQFKDILPYLVLSILACIPAYFLCNIFSKSPIALCISIITAVAIYYFGSLVYKFDEFVKLRQTLKSMLRK